MSNNVESIARSAAALRTGSSVLTAKIRAGIRRRYVRERIFRGIGISAIVTALAMLVILFSSIVITGYSALQRTMVALDISFDPAVIDPEGKRSSDALSAADYSALIKTALSEKFPGVTDRRERRDLAHLVSPGSVFQLRDMVMDDPAVIGTKKRVWLPANDDTDMFMKGKVGRSGNGETSRISEHQAAWIDSLRKDGLIEKRFNTTFFTTGDSREPELAGIRGAVVGSFYTLIVTLLISLPLGIATAVYLEEFAPQNIWTDIIEVNINNLAAVPSIVFGLLGLAVFLNFGGLPRSAPVVGGLVLSLMTLPIIIIASRAALKSVPPSIRDAALGVGASKVQSVMHHVLPLALPGMLTGTIIGMAHALGETAPLLMIGMVAFIVDIPRGIFDAATVLPVQIYLWSDSPERAFIEKTAAAIIVLLVFLVAMNATAIILRKKFERRW
jgi:phosphate transport system permease protein